MSNRIKNSEYMIRRELRDMAKQIKDVELSYYFDEVYDMHVVRVLPDDKYRTDEFARLQVALELRFILEFPSETIFFSPGTEVDRGKWEYVFKNEA